MVIDFHQAISDKFRLLSTLYSDEDFPEALACGPISKPWTGRWTSNVGYKDHPGVVAASFAATHSPWQQGTVQQDSATNCPPAVVGIANNSGSGTEVAVERQLDGFRALVGGAPPSSLPPKRAIKEAKMATTGPPSLTGHNLSPEGPQAISCSRHASDTVADCHVLERSLALYQRWL